MVDNLNRATTIGGVSRSYDIMGNTITKGSNTSMTWDCLNRMSTFLVLVCRLYDAHGNNVATLKKNGTDSYQLPSSDQRLYDAWGNIRVGNTAGEPNARHCANLGHLQDDESGLVYMRARYYEPSTGRFASEDISKNGHNWFIYSRNNPTNDVDPNGKYDLRLLGRLLDVLCRLVNLFSFLGNPENYTDVDPNIEEIKDASEEYGEFQELEEAARELSMEEGGALEFLIRVQEEEIKVVVRQLGRMGAWAVEVTEETEEF